MCGTSADQLQYCRLRLTIYRFIIALLDEEGLRRDGRAIYAEKGKLTVMSDGVTTGSVLPMYERDNCNEQIYMLVKITTIYFAHTYTKLTRIVYKAIHFS